jgi:hypothetical protein
MSDRPPSDDGAPPDPRSDEASAEGALEGPSLEGPPARLHAGLIATLDGIPLRSFTSDEGAPVFTTEDGAPIDKAREDDIVYLNPDATADESGWWSVAGLDAARALLFSDARFEEPPRAVEIDGESFSEGDVAAMLIAAGGSFTPAARSEPSPATFHRRLCAFLDAADGDGDDDDALAGEPGALGVADDDTWDYGFWKATLSTSDRADTPEGATSYQATVFWGEADAPSVYRYWVLGHHDDPGQLAGAGWHERPPTMATGDAPFAMTALDEHELSDLFPLAVDDETDDLVDDEGDSADRV